MMATRGTRDINSDNVRMGPLALFTLLTVIALSVLAVLAVSTANASLALSQRRATATHQLYLDETAAQTFVATLDGQLQGEATPEDALETARAAALASAPDGADEQLVVTASVADDRYQASFDCGNGRQLNIALRFEADGSYRVEEWRMTTVVNDEPVMGDLFGGF